MPEVGSASLAIIPSFKGFQSNLESGTGKALTAAGVSGGDKFGDAAGRSASTKFRSHIVKAGKIAAVGLGLAAAGAIKFAGDSIAEARDAQKVGAQTNAVIKSTGKAAKVTASDVGRLAEKLSNKAGIDDELIQSGENVLLTFTKIRNEAGEGNKVFDRGTLAALNMSVALDQDLKSSSIQVGKALNDPVKGVTALGRAGVQFTEDQKAAIKKMVETGDTLGAQKAILRELDTQFKGSARSQATESDKLAVAWGNLKEDLGTELIPVMDDLAVFLRKKGIPAVKDAAGWVRDDFVPAIKDAYEEMKPLIGGVKDLAGFINDLPKPAKIAGIAAVLGGVGFAKLRGGNIGGGGGVLGGIGKAVGLAKPVPVFVTNPGLGGLGGPAGPTSKLGKAASFASKAAVPVAIVAASGIALKEFYDWNHKDDKSVVEHAITGGGMGDKSRQFWAWVLGDSKEYDKSLGVVNNSWTKVRTQIDGAREDTVLYDGTIRKVPTLWKTVFETPGLLRDKALVEQYGSLLDGLPRDVKIRFTTSVANNNDTGEGGGTTPQPPGRSGPGVQIDIHGDVRPNDSREFLNYLQRHARGSSLDGVRSIP